MKYYLPAILSFFLLTAQAADKDSTIHFDLPDSVKAVQFIANVSVQSVNTKKEVFAGIQTDMVRLALESDKNKKEVVFEFPKSAGVMVTGIDVKSDEKGELEWDYNWNTNETYKLLLAIAADSAGNFVLYSGYIWLPAQAKWKLLGTCKITGQLNTIKNPSCFYSSGKKDPLRVSISEAWVQRNNGSWKKLDGISGIAPVVNLLSHIDSLQQLEVEKKIINAAIASGQTDVKENTEDVYYKIIREGDGRQVSVNDTVTVFYRLTLLNDTAVIDQAKDKPATFPLKRLIKGWQIGVPLIKVGGKIKLVIPSMHAYSIRTRSPKIPPNSILEFEVEVVDAKALSR